MVDNPPQFTLDHLTNYLQLATLITGEAPTEIKVSQQVFNWYREQRKRVAKNFNVGELSNKDEDQMFMGVKLIPKLELV